MFYEQFKFIVIFMKKKTKHKQTNNFMNISNEQRTKQSSISHHIIFWPLILKRNIQTNSYKQFLWFLLLSKVIDICVFKGDF